MIAARATRHAAALASAAPSSTRRLILTHPLHSADKSYGYRLMRGPAAIATFWWCHALSAPGAVGHAIRSHVVARCRRSTGVNRLHSTALICERTKAGSKGL